MKNHPIRLSPGPGLTTFLPTPNAKAILWEADIKQVQSNQKVEEGAVDFSSVYGPSLSPSESTLIFPGFSVWPPVTILPTLTWLN